MACTISPCAATLGAVVTGVRLAALDAEEWRAIEDAFHAHAVLIFPGQHLSADEQVAFARRFGEIEQLAPGRDTLPISNRKPDGTLWADGEGPMPILHGNEGWHTDSSYLPLAAKASVLSAEVVASRGGETEWADMRSAYESLDAATRARIATLSAYHSLKYSQGRLGYGARGDAGGGYRFEVAQAPLRPLVKIHPVTGRPSLFIGRHAYGIPGLAPDESEQLLDGLVEEACKPPRVLAHRWSPGDIAIWDNRCVLHRARPFDHREPRVMHHTRIAGDPATERA
jgi:alpha-ketoglutarate-dependent taurine dioxygenase